MIHWFEEVSEAVISALHSPSSQGRKAHETREKCADVQNYKLRSKVASHISQHISWLRKRSSLVSKPVNPRRNSCTWPFSICTLTFGQRANHDDQTEVSLRQRFAQLIMPKIDKSTLYAPSISTGASEGSGSSWSAKDDETLVQARAQGLNWNQISPRHFPQKTANACRKRHERLMERQNAEQWDGVKLDVLAMAYMEVRREMWSILAARVGEKWTLIEQKVQDVDFYFTSVQVLIIRVVHGEGDKEPHPSLPFSPEKMVSLHPKNYFRSGITDSKNSDDGEYEVEDLHDVVSSHSDRIPSPQRCFPSIYSMLHPMQAPPTRQPAQMSNLQFVDAESISDEVVPVATESIEPLDVPRVSSIDQQEESISDEPRTCVQDAFATSNLTPDHHEELTPSSLSGRRRRSCSNDGSEVATKRARGECATDSREDPGRCTEPRKLSKARRCIDNLALPGSSMLACPYFKRDPRQKQCSRACSGPGWPTVHRLK